MMVVGFRSCAKFGWRPES